MFKEGYIFFEIVHEEDIGALCKAVGSTICRVLFAFFLSQIFRKEVVIQNRRIEFDASEVASRHNGS